MEKIFGEKWWWWPNECICNTIESTIKVHDLDFILFPFRISCALAIRKKKQYDMDILLLGNLRLSKAMNIKNANNA